MGRSQRSDGENLEIAHNGRSDLAPAIERGFSFSIATVDFYSAIATVDFYSAIATVDLTTRLPSWFEMKKKVFFVNLLDFCPQR